MSSLSRKRVTGNFNIIITVVYPDAASITAATGLSTSDTTAQLTALQSVIHTAVNNTAVQSIITSQGAVVTGVDVGGSIGGTTTTTFSPVTTTKSTTTAHVDSDGSTLTVFYSITFVFGVALIFGL